MTKPFQYIILQSLGILMPFIRLEQMQQIISINIAVTLINLSYAEQYNSIKNLAFSNIIYVVGLMAGFGVIIPMSLLGLAN